MVYEFAALVGGIRWAATAAARCRPTSRSHTSVTGVAVVGAVYMLIAALITLIATLGLCAAALEWLRRCQSPREALAARR